MKIFSPSLKREMKDCILAVFWPRKDIYGFFKQCSVPKSALLTIGDWESQGYSRSAMVDRVFDALANQPDSGTLQFDVMLDALSTWTHFDEYWFNTQQKLDVDSAKRKIAALNANKERHIDKAKQVVAERRVKSASLEDRHLSYEEMKNEFYSVALESVSLQQRGYAFERFLTKMARFFGLKVTSAFRIKGTQIDGTIKYDGENYNIEAKWHDRSLSDEPIMAFCHKQEMNMHGRGIFISTNGYTAGTLSLLEKSFIKNTVLMDGEDVTLILSDLITLPELLDVKIHAAQTQGKFYIHPITGRSKIQS